MVHKMTTGIITPATASDVKLAGERGNIFKKQVLPFGSINYGDRKLEFSRDYVRRVHEAFRKRAFDTVPFILADEKNRHTLDPERARGTITDLSVEDDGLYATVELSDSAAKLVEEHPHLGVSVFLKEGYERPDGETFPVALQHVLGTFDPKVTGMGPWRSVNLSNVDDVGAIIDLSMSQIDKGDSVGQDTGNVTEEQLKELIRSVLNERSGEDGNGDGELSDEDLNLIASTADQIEALEGGGDESDGAQGEVEPVAASNSGESSQDVQLAQARIEEQNQQIAQMRSELDAKQFQSEKTNLVSEYGIPPAVVELARPLLEGSGHTVQLSNDTEQDAGQTMRKVLYELSNHVKLADLDGPVGFSSDLTDNREQEKSERDQFINQYREAYGL